MSLSGTVDNDAFEQSEAALRGSELRYRRLVENAPYCIHELDADGRFVSMNKAGLRMMGLEDPTCVIGVHCLDMVAGSDRPRIAELLLSARAGQASFFEFQGVNGRFFSSNLVPMPGGASMGITQDISERKRSEQTLHESEAKFRAMIEASPVPYALNDEQRNIVGLNPAFTQTFGYDLADIPTLAEWWPRAYPDVEYREWVSHEWQARLENAIRTGTRFEPLELNIRCKDGTRRTALVSAAPLGTSFKGIHLVVLHDITERKLAEEALRESEERYRTVVQDQTELICRFTPDCHLLWVNEAYARCFGKPIGELVGYSFLQFIPESARSEVRESFATFTPDQPVRTHEHLVVDSSGETRWLQWTNRAFFDDHGKLVKFQGVARDVTERKRAEEERRNLEVQIRNAQKLESLGVLAGGIAHDFNNLLTAMLGNANFALRKLPVESVVRPLILDIEKAALRAADLTQQMLAYSGRGKFVTEVLRLDWLVQEMSNLLKTVVSKKAMMKLHLEPATVEGDPTQLRQIVMNLITNASEALEERSGEIHIRTGVLQADSVFLRSPFLPGELPTGAYSFIEIKDNGSGMSAETIAKIFDPFFTTKFMGRGLGLAAVLGIVKGHRGTIKVDSTPGQGTRFQVLFPWHAGTATENAGADIPKTPPSGQGLVLVVEDEATVRSLVRLILEDAGFQVCEASDGRAGLDVFVQHREKIVLVLLDLTMPRMDGLETLDWLRELNAQVPVLVMSGFSEEEVAVRFAGRTANGFIQKPFRSTALIERISQLLPSTAASKRS